eukprot:scaffold216715_cov66-Attheya_sp.AAC.1
MIARPRKTHRRARETPATATATVTPVAAAMGSQPAGRVPQAWQSDASNNFAALFGTEETAAIQPYLDRAAEVDEEEVHRLQAEQLRSRSAGASAEGDALFYRLSQNPPRTAVVDQSRTILRKMGSGGLRSAQCGHTCMMPSNHFCRAVVPTSNVSIEGREHESICGTLACMDCKSKWPGEPEDYVNRCVVHKR